jgi:hypothetical protein
MCKPACLDFQLTSLLEKLKSAIESVFIGIYMEIKNSVDAHAHY